MEFTFEHLPGAVGCLIEKVSNIEHLLNFYQRAGNEVVKPITTEQAADYLNLEMPTLYALVQKRKVPFHKRGKKLYFFKDELVEWIKSGAANPEEKTEQQAEKEFLTANKKGGKI